MEAQRQELMIRAQRLRAEITQLFIDAGIWNEEMRRTGEAKIDPDPDGKLARAAASIDRMLRDKTEHEDAAVNWIQQNSGSKMSLKKDIKRHACVLLSFPFQAVRQKLDS
jgi:hypothetical protein